MSNPMLIEFYIRPSYVYTIDGIPEYGVLIRKLFYLRRQIRANTRISAIDCRIAGFLVQSRKCIRTNIAGILLDRCCLVDHSLGRCRHRHADPAKVEGCIYTQFDQIQFLFYQCLPRGTARCGHILSPRDTSR